jgi:ABC-type xylose transport system, periplasmic component
VIGTGCSVSNKLKNQTSSDLQKLSISEFEKDHGSNLDNISYYKYTGNVTIGFAMDSLKEERWQKDRDIFLAKAKELNANVRVTEADGDASIQISQAEELISQGVNVLVIIPVNGEASSEIVKKAHEAGVKVLSYDRLIKNSDLDYYISFDNEKVGELQGEALMKAVPNGNIAYVGGSPTDNNALLFRKGSMEAISGGLNSNQLHVVMDKYSTDWKPDEAYKNVKEMLATNKDNIKGIICANDGTASGAIQALKEVGLDGKIPVTGQDADLGALQRIAEGKQLMTVYKPVQAIAQKAVEMAVNIAENKPVETGSTVANGSKNVNSLLLKPIVVTKDNIKDTVVKDGWQTESDIYKNVK